MPERFDYDYLGVIRKIERSRDWLTKLETNALNNYNPMMVKDAKLISSLLNIASFQKVSSQWMYNAYSLKDLIMVRCGQKDKA